MQLEKQVPSLELCKRLKELGYPQNSIFRWFRDETNLFPVFNCWSVQYWKDALRLPSTGEHLAAPTAAELISYIPGALLSDKRVTYEIDAKYLFITKDEGTAVLRYGIADNKFTSEDDNLANCFANTIIWLVENEFAKFGEGE